MIHRILFACTVTLVTPNVIMADDIVYSTKVVDGTSVQVNNRVALNGKTATHLKLDQLPLIHNDCSKRFKFDSYANPKLKHLRQHCVSCTELRVTA